MEWLNEIRTAKENSHGKAAEIDTTKQNKAGWVTVRESFLSETRLRARRYKIDGEYLISHSDSYG